MGDAAVPAGTLQKSYFDVLGICCPSEVPLVEKLLRPLPGVHTVTVIVPSRTVIVLHDAAATSPAQIGMRALSLLFTILFFCRLLPPPTVRPFIAKLPARDDRPETRRDQTGPRPDLDYYSLTGVRRRPPDSTCRYDVIESINHARRRPAAAANPDTQSCAFLSPHFF
jgi:copper chaperone CopZ